MGILFYATRYNLVFVLGIYIILHLSRQLASIRYQCTTHNPIHNQRWFCGAEMISLSGNPAAAKRPCRSITHQITPHRLYLVCELDRMCFNRPCGGREVSCRWTKASYKEAVRTGPEGLSSSCKFLGSSFRAFFMACKQRSLDCYHVSVPQCRSAHLCLQPFTLHEAVLDWITHTYKGKLYISHHWTLLKYISVEIFVLKWDKYFWRPYCLRFSEDTVFLSHHHEK